MTTARYLAMAGEPEALMRWLTELVPQRCAPQRLNRVFDSANLVVFASPENRLLPLEEERGLLIGRIFRGRTATGPAESLSLSESRHAAWSGGRSLLEGKWGGYVAFVRDEGAVAVLRDPTGAVPAYFREARGIQLYFSDLEMLADLGLERPEVDEDFLRQWLTHPFLRSSRTGLVGHRELLPGTMRRSSSAVGASVESVWTPWPAAALDRQVLDFDDAARRVRELTLSTVPAQVAEIEAPLLELSGGLDSSIVGASLKHGGVVFRAANFVTAMPDGDERDYARRMAEHLCIDLAELREDDLPLDLSPPARRTLRPPLNPVLQPLHRALSQYARQSGSSDFVTGAGGDNLFGYLTTAAPALDAMIGIGLRGAWDTLQDVATLGECTIWKAAHFALRKQLRRKRPLWKRDDRFLAADALASEPEPHPWLVRPPQPLPGKIEHVESLVLIHHFLDPQHRSGETLHHPLLNQPLMEQCLAIPTWLWLRGGINRAVARAAFADLLPREVVRRRTKGSLESMCARAFARNRGRLADLLLGGELATRRLIDTRKVETYLGAAGRLEGDAYFRIFDLVSLELWLRSWRA